MGKFFTLAEAETLLPQVKKRLETAIKAKTEAEDAQRRLDSIAKRIHLLGGSVVSLEPVAQHRQVKEEAVQKAEECLREIHETGCLVKDLDSGLVDFPALLNGQEVYLCWKLGEAKIEYWHHVKDGFAGRKRIHGEFGGPTAGPEKVH